MNECEIDSGDGGQTGSGGGGTIKGIFTHEPERIKILLGQEFNIILSLLLLLLLLSSLSLSSLLSSPFLLIFLLRCFEGNNNSVH